MSCDIRRIEDKRKQEEDCKGEQKWSKKVKNKMLQLLKGIFLHPIRGEGMTVMMIWTFKEEVKHIRHKLKCVIKKNRLQYKISLQHMLQS